MKNETVTTKSTEPSQGDDGGAPPPPPPPPPPEQLPDGPASRGGNTVLKSGPLFISSKGDIQPSVMNEKIIGKEETISQVVLMFEEDVAQRFLNGIGWTSWKKRWFILTKTSLVFFRSDPSSIPQKGSEVNLTLGGIDLNNSGSVNVKADKKLLTVLFPDGRAFTLKAETSEDLHEWKSALEEALSLAPSAALVMGQNGIFKNEQADGADGSSEQLKDKQPAKSSVIGRPILLALEDIDGSPSFLEKALRFIEDHGVKIEGILRQAADVDDVMHRIREYEQGKTEFSAGEDAHVIADCVKYFLREMPSSPVPASCCNALLEACRSDRSNRVNAMRVAICETFPEPNRRLLQRILLMMQTVASHKTVNRMSTSAVAACMAPLLLRPLLGGECEIATDFDVGGDGSMQLLQAAAAANHAQAIVITLLEEYQTIFCEGTMSPGLYSDSEEDESEGEEVTDDDEYYEDDEQDDGTQESDAYTEDDPENALSGSYSESGGSGEDDLSDDKGSDNHSSRSNSLEERDFEVKDQSSSGLVKSTSPPHDETEIRSVPFQSSHSLGPRRNEVDEASGDESSEMTVGNKLTGHIKKSITLANDPGQNAKRPTVWGRTSAKKNLSMESMDCLVAEELEIQKLEALKIDLQNKIAEEVKGNAVMIAKLEQRKRELHERHLALEKDVAGLQDQLQKERDKRAALEAGLNPSRGHLPASVMIDEKLKRDLEEITQAEAEVTNLTKKFDELSEQINQRREQKLISMNESSDKLIHTSNHRETVKDRQETEDCAMPPLPGKSTSKDPPWEGAESRDGKRPESESTTGKHGHEKQQQDSFRSSNSKSTASTHSKRSGTRTERGQQGGNSTSSALTKLTNRLNFLKERRSQIANELQFLDKSKNPDKGLISPGKGRRSDLPPSPHNLDKGQGPEVPSSSNVEKSRGSGRPRSSENAEKVLQVEGQSAQDSDKSRKVDSQLLPNVRGGQPENQHPQVLDRGKSEGHVSYNSDKVKGSGSSKPVTIPRTNSR